jgi:hypothetical protein
MNNEDVNINWFFKKNYLLVTLFIFNYLCLFYTSNISLVAYFKLTGNEM